MNEQMLLIQEVNDFLKRRGFHGTHLAEMCGISKSVFRSFKCGRKLLTQTQAAKLREFMADYDRRLDA